MGEYTKRIGDFSVLPSDVEEGRVGNYWYHEGTQAFFDDSDHYKMIKAMCELSCSVCDGIDKSRRKEKFKDIEELKGHLFHKHKLFMCSMCLEGKKVHCRSIFFPLSICFVFYYSSISKLQCRCFGSGDVNDFLLSLFSKEDECLTGELKFEIYFDVYFILTNVTSKSCKYKISATNHQKHNNGERQII